MFDKELDLATRFVVGEVYVKDDMRFLVVRRTPCYVSFKCDVSDKGIIRKKLVRDNANDEYVAWYEDYENLGKDSPKWILHSRENLKKS